MESHQQMNQNQNQNPEEDIGKSSYLCRQSSTRWTPTTEQIKVLKELYYNNGVRSPSTDQIQNICAMLRMYGKIEGKNVFYWFQNHKARDRQKKRLTPINNIIPNTTPPPQYHNRYINPTININGYPHPGGVASSSSIGCTMENNFRDCSVSGGNMNQNLQWGANYNPYPNPTSSYTNFLGKISAVDQAYDYDYDYDDGASPQRETLPLFPMRNEDHHQFGISMKPSGSDSYGWANGGGNGTTTSLELSLYSCGYGSCYSQN